MATSLQYVGLCDAELAAAELALSKKVRVGHLQQAYRYAKLAVAEGDKERARIQTVATLGGWGPPLHSQPEAS